MAQYPYPYQPTGRSEGKRDLSLQDWGSQGRGYLNAAHEADVSMDSNFYEREDQQQHEYANLAMQQQHQAREGALQRTHQMDVARLNQKPRGYMDQIYDSIEPSYFVDDVTGHPNMDNIRGFAQAQKPWELDYQQRMQLEDHRNRNIVDRNDQRFGHQVYLQDDRQGYTSDRDTAQAALRIALAQDRNDNTGMNQLNDQKPDRFTPVMDIFKQNIGRRGSPLPMFAARDSQTSSTPQQLPPPLQQAPAQAPPSALSTGPASYNAKLTPDGKMVAIYANGKTKIITKEEAIKRNVVF